MPINEQIVEFYDTDGRVLDEIDLCDVRSLHHHDQSAYNGARRLAAYWGWYVVEEFIEFHEDPAARRKFQRRWGAPPNHEYVEDLDLQLSELDYISGRDNSFARDYRRRLQLERSLPVIERRHRLAVRLNARNALDRMVTVVRRVHAPTFQLKRAGLEGLIVTTAAAEWRLKVTAVGANGTVKITAAVIAGPPLSLEGEPESWPEWMQVLALAARRNLAAGWKVGDAR